MPLRETEAIVLRTYRLGEADKIVSLFARQMGRLRAVAAGARRTKSRYGSTLEPLSYIRLWVFERENRDLLRINSAELLESFFDMQKDYRVQVAAQYVAEVAEQLLPEREVNERAFRLLMVVLKALKRTGEVNRPLLYFNYWLLRLGGFLPELEVCGACGRSMEGLAAFYSEGSENLLCSNCRSQAAKVLSSEVRRIELAFRGKSLDAWIAEGPPPNGCLELRHFLEAVVESHAGKKLLTRPILAAEV
ncbi:MAG: DNA repair protein RecO [Deltaproteobacteria bacterium]